MPRHTSTPKPVAIAFVKTFLEISAYIAIKIQNDLRLDNIPFPNMGNIVLILKERARIEQIPRKNYF